MLTGGCWRFWHLKFHLGGFLSLGGGGRALDSLIFKLLINSLATRFLAEPKKQMGFTWGDLWTHITEHSMSKDEYRNMLAMQGVPNEVFDIGEK